MARTRTSAVLIALLLAATACSGDDEPDADVARTDAPVTEATTPEPDVEVEETSEPEPEVPVEPVTWGSSGRMCTEFTGPTVIWEWIRVNQPLTLRSLEPVGLEGGFEPGAVSIVAVPRGEIPFTGSIKGTRIPERHADDVAWDDREPVRGFTADRGRYYVFLQAEITGDATYDGFELSWTDEIGDPGTSTWDIQDRYRRDCKL